MKTNYYEKLIPSVNFHVWESCNMRCKFCFAPFHDAKVLLPKGHLPKEDAIKLIQELAFFGFEKITFAGGEPTLCPWISELIYEAKVNGLTTMMVTNGTRINDDFLKKHEEILDWIILSVDSLSDENNKKSGRAITGKKVLTKENYIDIIKVIKNYKYQLKINTVVHQLNYTESLLNFINEVQSKRWKVFQVLPIKGENDEYIDEFKIEDEQYNFFLKNHQSLISNGILISENNSEMKDSYVMIDPSGRFYTNKNGYQEYSDFILEKGVKEAYSMMQYSYENFKNRGGLYQWKKTI